MEYWANKLPNHQIFSIFFGGGTPSLMSERTINKILAGIHKLWNCKSELEISLEANPTSVEAKKFKNFQNAGVNRLSMGIQALNDKDLKRLGRLHTAKEAKEALDIAIKYFTKVSFDLIYGRQHQTLTNWENELVNALTFSVGHLSLYQLTIENNTRFGSLLSKGRLRGLPNELKSTKFYEITNQICESQNFYAYEVSNYSLTNQECQHNLNYWRGGSFLGIGPGAHGRVDVANQRYQTIAPSYPETWLKQALNRYFNDFTYKQLSRIEHAEEYVIMALRLREGLNMNHYFNLTNKNLREEKIEHLLTYKLIQIDGDMLKTTNAGRLLTNYVVHYLLS